jgi:hypothetical protein
MNEETWTSGTDAMVTLRLYNINLSDDPDCRFFLFSHPPMPFKVSHSFASFLASEPASEEDARAPDFAPRWETDLILPVIEEFLPECLPSDIPMDASHYLHEQDFEIQVSLCGKALKILLRNHPAFATVGTLATARETSPMARETPSTARETETPSSEYTEGLHDGPYEEEALELSFLPKFAYHLDGRQDPRFNPPRFSDPITNRSSHEYQQLA